MNFTVVIYAQRPDLIEPADELAIRQWPEFMLHDPVANRLWEPAIMNGWRDFQFMLLDEGGGILAVGNSIPAAWDGTADGLPPSWDAALEQGYAHLLAGRTGDTLCALSIAIRHDLRGAGLSKTMVRAMKDLGRAHGLAGLIAPVRPNRKSLYPLTPMERYITWTQPDGSPFDPWMRVHWREGARVVKVAPEAMRIPGTVAQWEAWAGMAFPESGAYVVPGALVPVTIDREADEGCYVEPNVWMHHP